MIQLRDYQQECIDAVQHDWRRVDRTLAVMATGTGKTIVFLALLDQLRERGELTRGLIIAHRRELIHQPLERAWGMFPELAWNMGVVMADQDDIGARVPVATVQSLNSGDRLERMLSAGAFSHIIIDEAHHGTAQSYMDVLDRLRGAKVLGMTATPLRTDGDGLSKVFQKCSYRLPIKAAIKRGALVKFDALGVSLPIDFSGLRETEDGWEAEPMGDLLTAGNVLDIVLEKWSEYAGDRQTILFTASVKQAEITAQYLADHGVKAAYVSGKTPHAERDHILEMYRKGDVQVVCNCMVLTEGFDAPETSCVVMLAPTKSDLVYVQRLGRGLRIAPGKADCRVLDFVPMIGRNVVMAGDVLGKPRRVKKAEEKAKQAGLLVALSVDSFGSASTIDPGALIVRVLDLLRKDGLAWSISGHYATAALSEDAALAVALPDPQRVEKAEQMRLRGELFDAHEMLFDFIKSVRLYLVTREGYRWEAGLHGCYATFEDAKSQGDVIADELLDPTLARRTSSWRRQPASDRQLQFMAQLGIVAPKTVSKGQAAQLITQRLVLQAVWAEECILQQRAATGEAIYA